jgi:hypothetical protein
VLPFEILPLDAFEPQIAVPTRSKNGTRRALPLYVEPLAEESLFSWLHRLATRLQVSFHALARQSFGIDDRAGHTVWWHRLHVWRLAKISQQTGVSLSRLRQMTFDGLQPPYREDEDAARFGGRRYDTWAPKHRAFRFVVCADCIEHDQIPYVRTLWQLGWLAACPIHRLILISRCENCHSGLRVPAFATVAPFSPQTCIRCGQNLLIACPTLADTSVLQLQDALLKAKQTGVTEIGGLGTLALPKIVALADIILGTFWTDSTLDDRNKIFGRYEHSAQELYLQKDLYGSRHGSLRFIAWFIDGWPDSFGARIGRVMLARGLNNKQNRLSHHIWPRWKGHPWSPSPHDFAPEILFRLRKLIEE